MEIALEAIKNLFKKPFTERYPYVKKKPYDRFRGNIKFSPEKCIGCKLCETYCPAKAITFKSKGKIDFDMTKCIYCGNCHDVCPTGAITYTTDFELANKDKKKIKSK